MDKLNELAKMFVDVRTKRLALEKEANEIKNGAEKLLRYSLLMMLEANGVKSVHVENIGRIVRTEKNFYSIADLEKFAYRMFKSMQKAQEEGRPLSNALLLQKRVHKEALESHMDTLDIEEKDKLAELFGINYITVNDISFTQIGAKNE